LQIHQFRVLFYSYLIFPFGKPFLQRFHLCIQFLDRSNCVNEDLTVIHRVECASGVAHSLALNLPVPFTPPCVRFVCDCPPVVRGPSTHPNEVVMPAAVEGFDGCATREARTQRMALDAATDAFPSRPCSRQRNHHTATDTGDTELDRCSSSQEPARQTTNKGLAVLLADALLKKPWD
jgi:hypothetical protein